jgi:hypothetical protein
LHPGAARWRLMVSDRQATSFRTWIAAGQPSSPP